MTFSESLQQLFKTIKRKLMNPTIYDVLCKTTRDNITWRDEPTGPSGYRVGDDYFLDRAFTPVLRAKTKKYVFELADYPCGDGLASTGYYLVIRDRSDDSLVEKHYNRFGLRELHRTVYSKLGLKYPWEKKAKKYDPEA